MRILRLIHSLRFETGGPPRALADTAAWHGRWGHSTTIICCDPPGLSDHREFSAEVVALGAAGSRWDDFRRMHNWLKSRSSEFDAALAHGLWHAPTLCAWRAWKRSGLPYWIFPHGMLDPWFRRATPAKHALKQVRWWLGEGQAVAASRGLLFTAEEERRLARGVFRPYKARERVVPYGVTAPDLSRERCRADFADRFPESANGRNWVFLGRLHPKKGVEALLRAFAQAVENVSEAASARLWIGGCGDTAYERSLRRLCSGLGLDARVRWLGHVGGDLKWELLGAAEALVLPSHQENFGLAAAEALAAGTPALVSRDVNIWREIVEAGAGRADAAGVEGTARLLTEWARTCLEKREQASANAAACYNARFDAEQAAAALLDIFTERPTGTNE